MVLQNRSGLLVLSVGYSVVTLITLTPLSFAIHQYHAYDINTILIHIVVVKMKS